MEVSRVLPGWAHLAASHRAFLDGDYAKGLALGQRVDMPGFYWYHVAVAANLARLGRLEEAREHVQAIRQANPDFERDAYAEWRTWLWEEQSIEKLVGGLREAGMHIASAGPIR
jgi:hypothetical protein